MIKSDNFNSFKNITHIGRVGDECICAISTPQGVGAIAIIRISGIDAFEIADKIFVPTTNGKRIIIQNANTIQRGKIKANSLTSHESEQNSTLDVDEVLVSVFRAPHSFTGENIVEFYCHGSQFIQQQIVKLLVSVGCRLALPGEFTQRAFLNGKIDLSQAEAVADLISSQTETASRIALKQMRGGFSSELAILRKRMLTFISLIELELDFSEEDVEFANRNDLKKLIEEIIAHVNILADSFLLGNAIKKGIQVAIVGNTNTGKSTLLNRFLNEERAIVSEVHGTTRDAIEEIANIKGIMFRFIDTAGIRPTDDKIENIGIKITYDKISQASIILLVVEFDNNIAKIKKNVDEIFKIIDLKHQRLVVVVNKIDLINVCEIEDILSKLKLSFPDLEIITISAKYNKNIDTLMDALTNTISLTNISYNDTIISNIRHYEALNNANESLKRVQIGLIEGISNDFLAQDIREALYFIGSITGDITNNEILGNIFKNFCIGK